MAETSVHEEWRPVVGYEGLYEVSSLGRVRGIDRTDAQGRRWPGRILKQNAAPNGYLLVSLSSGGSVRQMAPHRLAAESFLGDRPVGHEVNHRDADKKNNAVVNLEWVTREQNIKHAIENGLHNPARGESSGASKLTEPEVLAIRRCWSDGESQYSIAKRLGLTKSAIWKIVRRETWTHV